MVRTQDGVGALCCLQCFDTDGWFSLVEEAKNSSGDEIANVNFYAERPGRYDTDHSGGLHAW